MNNSHRLLQLSMKKDEVNRNYNKTSSSFLQTFFTEIIIPIIEKNRLESSFPPLRSTFLTDRIMRASASLAAEKGGEPYRFYSDQRTIKSSKYYHYYHNSTTNSNAHSASPRRLSIPYRPTSKRKTTKLKRFMTMAASMAVGNNNRSCRTWKRPARLLLLTLSIIALSSICLTVLPMSSFGSRLSSAFVRIKVMHSQALYIISQVVGWIYFVAWSVSFYPQLFLNWKRKSVYGLNFDFLALNLTGFICYTIYTCALFWNPVVQADYQEVNPRGANPVAIQDVFFTIHAVFITSLTIAQCFIYERGHQRVSFTCMGILSVLWACFFVFLGLAFWYEPFSWFKFVSCVSYIKIAVTLIKYIPQAYYNYRRKSTVGWSIGNVLLDFTGGSMSILQMFLQSYNYNDWEEVFLDPTKFWLGALSIIFDTLFILQHYVFYRGNEANEFRRMEEENDEEQAEGLNKSDGEDYGSGDDRSSDHV